jgi:hypothetical protein
MRHDHRKRQGSDMPSVHRSTGADLAAEDEMAPTRGAARDLARLRAMAASTSDPLERQTLIAEIQDRFGNAAARSTVERLRAGTEEDA